jgi:hypothetical protein
VGRRALSWARLLGGALVIAVLVRTVGAGPFLAGVRGLGPGALLAATALGGRPAAFGRHGRVLPVPVPQRRAARRGAREHPPGGSRRGGRRSPPGAARTGPSGPEPADGGPRDSRGGHTTRPPRGPSSFPHRSCAPGSSACSCSPPGPRAWTPGRPGCCRWPSSSCSPPGCPSTSGGGAPGRVAAWVFGAAGAGAAQGVAVAGAFGVLGLVATLPGLVVLFLEGRAPADPARSRRRAARRRPRW